MLTAAATMNAQDFASRFRGEHKNDSNIACVTISPKMMQEMIENDEDKKEELVDIISELKSMQMCTSKVNAKRYFDDALSLVDKNSSLFETVHSQSDKDSKSRIVVRRKKNCIIELVMLMCSDKGFSLINFTGKMDADGIARLAGEAKRGDDN